MDIQILKENRIHGDPLFPLSLYSMECGEGDTLFECHWHDELELLVINSGKVLVQVDTDYYELFAGQAIFINGGEIHAAYNRGCRRCSFSAIVFGQSLINSYAYDLPQKNFIDPLIKRKYILPIHLKASHKWEEEALSSINTILSLSVSRPYAYELIIKGHIYIIFSLLLSNADRKPEKANYSDNSGKIEKLKRVLAYIQSNYSEKISLNDLARLSGMSEGHFCKFFKAMVNKKPMDYLNCYRVSRAAVLIENTDEKIIDISMKTGFDNCSYFIKTFKHYMKCTPSQYRKSKAVPLDSGNI